MFVITACPRVDPTLAGSTTRRKSDRQIGTALAVGFNGKIENLLKGRPTGEIGINLLALADGRDKASPFLQPIRTI